MRKKAVIFWAAAVMVSMGCEFGYANGFKILGVKSARATAMGEAFIAQADNPSAVAFNPAGLIQLEGTQVSLEGTVANSWVRHTAPAGNEENILDRWQVLPAVFVTSDLGMENMAVGLGVTVPSGLSSEWSETGFARYVDTFSELILIDINPSIAYRINDRLSVGGGISHYYSSSVSETVVDYGVLVGLPGGLDGGSRLEGKGTGWGYNLGVLYRLNNRHSFAATFKSPFRIEYRGNIKLTNIPAFMGLGRSFESDAKTSINFPAVAVFGYAYHPTDRLKLEFNLDWTGWETLNSIVVDFYSQSLSDVTYQYDYENTFAYKFGIEYLVTERFKLRGGYIYNESAVPEENWRPSLPDTNSHFLCSGFGYQIGKVTIDGAIQVILYEDRTVNNNVDDNETLTSSSVDGKYRNFGLGFSLSATYSF